MPRANLNRAVVLAAAAELADEAGAAELTVSALARRLGVQPASLYSHVRDRAALVSGVHELALGELAERVATEVAGRSGHEALAGLAAAHRSYAADRPGAWAVLQQPAPPEVVASAAAARVGGLLLAVVRGYELDETAAVDASRLVGAAIGGYLALERSGSFAHRTPLPAASWDAAVDALDRALRTWPAPGAHPPLLDAPASERTTR